MKMRLLAQKQEQMKRLKLPRLAIAFLLISATIFGAVPEPATLAPITVFLSPELIHNIAQMVVPFAVTLSDQHGKETTESITFADLIYCGPVTPTKAKFVAILYAGREKNFLKRSIIRQQDCNAPLPPLVQRAKATANSPPWIAATTVFATFTAWRLDFSVGDIAETQSPSIGTPHARDMLFASRTAGRPVKTVATSALKFTLETGDHLAFDIAPEFVSEGIVVKAVSSSTAKTAPLPSAAKIIAIFKQPRPAFTNVLVLVPHSFVSQIASFYRNRDVNLQANPMLVKIRDLQYSGSLGQIRTSGNVSVDNPPIQGHVSVEWGGDDLAVRQINVSPDDLGFVSNTLTAQFKGQLFRPVGVQTPIPFRFADKDIILRGQVLKVTSSSQDLRVYGSAVLELR